MSRLRALLPSRAMAVALVALFLNLTGIAYAATGGNFILGQSNAATTQSTLAANLAGRALQLTNTSTAAGAAPLGLTPGAGRPPFVTPSTTKVTNLNADLLDGLDSGAFVQGTAARITFNRLSAASGSGYQTILSAPGFFDVQSICVGSQAQFWVAARNGRSIDLANDSFWTTLADDGRSVGVAFGGGSGTVQIGETYRPGGFGFPRKRVATVVVSGDDGDPCLFQVQAVVQGT